MPNTPTPGQVAYEAYQCDCGCWQDLEPEAQQRWESVAQAVLACHDNPISHKETLMKQGHFEEHWNDADGNPAGGVSSTRGATISWQNGPLGRGETRREPNGAFVEDIIQIALGRLRYYQAGRFACDTNQEAITGLEMAAEALERRTRDREAREVEGTHHA